MSIDHPHRRQFLEGLAALVAAADVGLRSSDGLPGWSDSVAAADPQTPSSVKPAGTFNGVQMGPHTIVDEGIERTLDLLADTAATNAVMPYSHAYNAGLIKPLNARANHGVPLTDNRGRNLPLVW